MTKSVPPTTPAKSSKTQPTQYRGPLWRRSLAFIFAFGAYSILSVHWAFAFILYVPFLTTVMPKAAPATPAPAAPPSSDDAGSLFMIFLGLAVMVVVLGFTAYFLAKLPGKVVRGGNKATSVSSKAATQAFIKATHQKDSKKLRKTLEPLAVLILRVVALLLPLLLVGLARFVEGASLDPAIALFVSAMLANMTAVLFALQDVCAVRRASS